MTKLEVERFLSAVYAVASLVNAEFKMAMSGTEEQCAKSVATAHFQRLDAHRGYSISFTEFKDWYLSAPSAGEPMHHRSLAPFTYVVGRALALALATAASFKTTLTALERAGVGAAQAYAAAQIASISMGRAAQTRRQILPTAAPEQYTASPLQRAMAVTSTATPAPASARMLRIGGGRSPDAQRIRGAVAAAEVQRAAADDARARNLDYDALTKDPRSVRVNRHGSISIGGGGSNLDAQRIDDADVQRCWSGNGDMERRGPTDMRYIGAFVDADGAADERTERCAVSVADSRPDSSADRHAHSVADDRGGLLAN
jgi:hypothetical protein